MIAATERLVVELAVADVTRSLAFYRAIGFQVRRVEARFAELSFAGNLLMLAADPAQAPGGANLRILVDDVDARWATVQALGVRVLFPIRDARYGLRDFLFMDPDGNQLRFAQKLG